MKQINLIIIITTTTTAIIKKNFETLCFALVLGKSEKGLQYRVKVPKAETLFLAVEARSENRTNGLSWSKWIRGDCTLNVLDQCGELAFVMRINSQWTYTLNKLHVSGTFINVSNFDTNLTISICMCRKSQSEART